MVFTALYAGVALSWLILLLLPFKPYTTKEILEPASEGNHPETDLTRLTVLIPARNEKETITRVLEGLKGQGKGLTTIVVDDNSQDGTAVAAKSSGLENLTVLSGAPLKEGWSGKLWALEQGRVLVQTPYTLLLDGDILLMPGMIRALMQKAEKESLSLVSVMAFLKMQGFWEKLLIPAFIYFFKLLYPFSLANKKTSRVAAAAGGCLLAKTEKLEEMGGFKALAGELIDDCALAKKVKRAGGGIFIGLSHGAISLRGYAGLAPIWHMVARTAYTQLKYSPILLVLCAAGLMLGFGLPVWGLFAAGINHHLAILAFIFLALSYAPTLAYYRRPMVYAATLPLAALLYLCMTLYSALRYYRGTRSVWKGRVYQ